MFDLAWTEMLVIAVITILVVGPKDLPKVMRGIGNIMGKARAFADKFRSDIDSLARETEMEDLRKQARAYQDRFRQQQMALEQDFLDPTTGAPRAGGSSATRPQTQAGAEQGISVDSEQPAQTAANPETVDARKDVSPSSPGSHAVRDEADNG